MGCSPHKLLIRVDFPLPLGPISEIKQFFLTDKLMSEIIALTDEYPMDKSDILQISVIISNKGYCFFQNQWKF